MLENWYLDLLLIGFWILCGVFILMVWQYRKARKKLTSAETRLQEELERVKQQQGQDKKEPER